MTGSLKYFAHHGAARTESAFMNRRWLAKLGYVGFIGLLGLISGNPSLYGFYGFFGFFAFRDRPEAGSSYREKAYSWRTDGPES
jgi:hypothetical protein